ncbi:NAD(P)/FAD-dependent oxidoreductase [Cyanobium sp. LEGE 06143]|uniref:NAD(P)/FAD-dependent oxidoreductase n=1 Tax=Cyanobium sp. LEGE 06143 TaxID=945727 RepID=UPI002102FCC1|nr:NAD(P)/FAD-dependent oxidoreductase [Cyanobium sp. LEGE 06143]
MAAIIAAEAGVRDIHVLEATAEPLQKVRISGGGRCNVTHACWDPRSLVGHYPRGQKALRGPFARFACGDAVAWFAEHGLDLVEEADGRLFPRSNRSSSVVTALRQAARRAGVTVHLGTSAQQVARREGGFALQVRVSGASTLPLLAERLVLATGGHPSGRRLAVSLGHTQVPPVPSLFTLALEAQALTSLAGVVMDPVQLTLELPDGSRVQQDGPVLITHWGLSGPATLRLTAFAARALHAARYRAQLLVDWTGGRPEQQLTALLAAARSDQAKRQLANARPWPELSRRLWLHLLQSQGVDPAQRWADLTRRNQQALVQALSRSRYGVRGRGPFGEEFVSAGGVPLDELSTARMESRSVPGLYMAGELLDVDGVTGGFNFQHCWTSGWLAGRAIASASQTGICQFGI